MEGEINNFVAVWIIVLASLCYCHTIGKLIPHGLSRFFAIVPVVCLFLWIPLTLSSFVLAGSTSFLVAWVANFNLLLFAFGKGPLSSSSPPISLLRFLPMACIPVKIQSSSTTNSNPSHEIRDCDDPSQESKDFDDPSEETKDSDDPSQETEDFDDPSHQKIKEKDDPKHQIPQSNKKGQFSPFSLTAKAVILVLIISFYNYKEYFHPKFLWLIYCLNFYFAVQLSLDLFAALTRALAQVEVKPFNKPYMATSIHDFWGRRWNLMVSGALHSTIYEPVYFLSERVVTKKWASVPAILVTFLVSGLMHELIFFYIGRMTPNGHVTCFFIIHGAFLAAENIKRKTLSDKYRLPAIVSGPLALGFVVATSFWLFFPPFFRVKPHTRACSESLAFMEFVNNRRLVSPKEISCPIFLA